MAANRRGRPQDSQPLSRPPVSSKQAGARGARASYYCSFECLLRATPKDEAAGQETGTGKECRNGRVPRRREA